MALQTSLDASTLDVLFTDDWENLYKPLQIVDTVFVTNADGTVNGNIISKIDDALSRQDVLERNISEMEQNLKDISINVDSIQSEQDEINNFLNSYNQWENQKGSKL